MMDRELSWREILGAAIAWLLETDPDKESRLGPVLQRELREDPRRR
jgi:hypothetical protein